MTTNVIYLVYDGFELIDLAGPSAVFNLANELDGNCDYNNLVASTDGGLIKTNTNLEISSSPLNGPELTSKDMILAMGGQVDALMTACKDIELCAWLRHSSAIVGRVGSICTGSFVLGASGVINKHKATTHWGECERLSNLYHSVEVVVDTLYVTDGKVWTSAGGTAGVDMALAIVAQDHGPYLAARIAKRLVVYLHRPGYQSQFSDVLTAQTAKHGEFSDLVAWIEANLSQTIKVEDMAGKSNMSLRSFHRKFTEATGLTPFKFVEVARMKRAKQLLESGMPPKVVSGKVGFSSVSGFQTAFKNHFGIPPGMQTLMHGVL